jgi:hypothetical protein
VPAAPEATEEFNMSTSTTPTGTDIFNQKASDILLYLLVTRFGDVTVRLSKDDEDKVSDVNISAERLNVCISQGPEGDWVSDGIPDDILHELLDAGESIARVVSGFEAGVALAEQWIREEHAGALRAGGGLARRARGGRR